jgi:hypothetical protein
MDMNFHIPGRRQGLESNGGPNLAFWPAAEAGRRVEWADLAARLCATRAIRQVWREISGLGIVGAGSFDPAAARLLSGYAASGGAPGMSDGPEPYRGINPTDSALSKDDGIIGSEYAGMDRPGERGFI